MILKGRSHSIRKRINVFMATIFLCIFIVAIISNFNYIVFINENKRYFLINDHLDSFYKSMDKANIDVCNYFYIKGRNEFDNYKANIEEANQNLYSLISMSNNENMKWRFSLLINMVQTYIEDVELFERQLNEQTINYQDVYARLNKTAKLIKNTNLNYYQIINDDMKTKISELQVTWFQQIGVSIALVIIALVMGIIISNKSIHSITKPIQKLVENIQLIRNGQYNTKQIIHRSLELGILIDALDDMAGSIRTNIKNIEEKALVEKKLLEKENENLKIKTLLTETELRALQAQINPHFLFNTLSMISKCAYIEGAIHTCTLMETLGDLMRYSIDMSNKISDLNQEIKSLKNYIYLQEKRLGKRVSFNLSIDDDIPNIKMPAMILQPIVENCVIHGVRNRSSARIDIKASINEDKIKLVIEDNGEGIDHDLLELINESVDKATQNLYEEKSKNIGIYNVRKRLAVYFGDKHEFIIESNKGQGTKVEIIIPV